jgi:LPXTG-motif cell wall-anchored protein
MEKSNNLVIEKHKSEMNELIIKLNNLIKNKGDKKEIEKIYNQILDKSKAFSELEITMKNSKSQFGGATTDFFFKGNRKWIFITVMVLLLGGIGFYIYKKRKNRFGKRH